MRVRSASELRPVDAGSGADEGTPGRPELTPRQHEILEMVANGLSYKEVGAALHLSENTMKYHMGEILQRLHLKNREQVVAYALRRQGSERQQASEFQQAGERSRPARSSRGEGERERGGCRDASSPGLSVSQAPQLPLSPSSYPRG